MVAASYPFLDVLWSMVIFFAFVIWIWLLITVFADVFRRRDIGGGMKAIWIIFVILLPYLGVLIYLIAEHNGMADRSEAQMKQIKSQQDDYIKSVAGSSPADQIAQAKTLLDSGAITPGRVRRHQGEGARLGPAPFRRGCGASDAAAAPKLRCSRYGRNDPDRVRRLGGREPRTRPGDRGGEGARATASSCSPSSRRCSIPKARRASATSTTRRR